MVVYVIQRLPRGFFRLLGRRSSCGTPFVSILEEFTIVNCALR